MKQIVLLFALAATALSGAACKSSEEIIDEGLRVDNPAPPDRTVGPPPVPPEALEIAPTLMPPTRTSRIDPDPILPKMDDAWKNRRFPPGASPGTPADRPREQEGPPEGLYQPETPDAEPPDPADAIPDEDK